MNATYKFKTGEIVKIFVWDDMLDANPTFLRTNEEINGKPLKVLFDNKAKKKYFVYKGEKKYFEDFEYPSYEEILKNFSSYNYDEILACFLKEPDKICIIDNTKKIEVLSGNFGLCNGDENIKTLMVPKKDGRYSMSQWHFKIEFVNMFDCMNNFCRTNTYYFCDLYSLLKEGYIELVNKNEMLEKIKLYTKNYKAQIKKEQKNILLRFIANIKRKTKKYNYVEKIIKTNSICPNETATSFYVKNNICVLLDYEGILIPILD